MAYVSGGQKEKIEAFTISCCKHPEGWVEKVDSRETAKVRYQVLAWRESNVRWRRERGHIHIPHTVSIESVHDEMSHHEKGDDADEKGRLCVYFIYLL